MTMLSLWECLRTQEINGHEISPCQVKSAIQCTYLVIWEGKWPFSLCLTIMPNRKYVQIYVMVGRDLWQRRLKHSVFFLTSFRDNQISIQKKNGIIKEGKLTNWQIIHDFIKFVIIFGNFQTNNYNAVLNSHRRAVMTVELTRTLKHEQSDVKDKPSIYKEMLKSNKMTLEKVKKRTTSCLKMNLLMKNTWGNSRNRSLHSQDKFKTTTYWWDYLQIDSNNDNHYP